MVFTLSSGHETRILRAKHRPFPNFCHILYQTFFDAIRIINRNVSQGKCRIEPVCEELGVGRTLLHRLFANAGLGSPGAYIKGLQFRFAMKLLRVSRLPVAEIAYRVGFASPTQFNAFIHKYSGKPPIAHRGRAPLNA